MLNEVPDITEVEKRIAELSEAMSKSEVNWDITKLVDTNLAYEQAETRLAELTAASIPEFRESVRKAVEGAGQNSLFWAAQR